MPTQKTRQELIDELTQCGTLNYQDMIDFIYSVFFLTDGETPDVYLSRLTGRWNIQASEDGKYDTDYFVSFNESIYRSTVDNNQSTPGSSPTWIEQNYSSMVTYVQEYVQERIEGISSAYDVAVENGFVGTQQEWLDSLKGDPGAIGGVEIPLWTPDPFTPGRQRIFQGDYWIANTNTLSSDIPGISNKWSRVLSALKPYMKDLDKESGWEILWTDSDNGMYGGFDINGAFKAFLYALNSIDGNALKESSVDLTKLTPNTRALMLKEVDPESGYLYVFVDSNNNKLMTIGVDSFIEGNFKFTLQDGSIPITKLAPELQAKINLAGGTNIIDRRGDSLSAGAGGGGVTAVTEWQLLVGDKYNCINSGVGGENVPTIAARQGAVPCIILDEFTLPADLTPIQISSVPNNRLRNSLYNSEINMLKQGQATSQSVNPCYVQDVECTLIWNGSSATDPNGTWSIRRNTVSSNTKKITAKSQIITSSAKKHRNPFIIIIEMGQNGGYANDAELIDYYKRMIEFSGCSKYLCTGMHTGSPSSRSNIEKLMFDNFGSRYLNIREYFSTYAFDDMGITPTSEDLTAMANGTFPPSFWASPTDAIHGNANFYKAKARFEHKRATELGYFN